MHSEFVPNTRDLKATGPAEVTRLYRYFALLRRVAHPGIVEVHSQEFSTAIGLLRLVAINGSTFGRTQLPDLRTVATTMTALTVTVAHLHERGVIHGHLSPSTIMISRLDYRPVITDLTRARPKQADVDEAVDCYALGRLMLTKLPKEADLLRLKINGSLEDTVLLSSLRQIAMAALHEDPLMRPSAREMAIQLRRLTAPTAAPKAKRKARHRKSKRQTIQHHRRTLVAAGAAAVAVGSFVMVGPALAETVEQSRRPVLVTPPLPQPCVVRPPAEFHTDVDGDGCADAVALSNGSVTVNGEPIEVAQPGDVLALGRWREGSPRTVALLRTPTGRLFVFDAWPGENDAITPRTVTTIAGASGLSVVPEADGTDMLRITTRSGKAVDVDPAVQTDTKPTPLT